MTKINILSSAEYLYLRDNLTNMDPTFVDMRILTERFPDGEYHWIVEDAHRIRGKPAVYICGTINEKAIFELYNIASTLVREQCCSLHLVLPYFGYSTMERANQRGEATTAKNIACLLSSIPKSPHGNFIYLLDLHSAGIQYYFERSVHPIYLTSNSIVKQMIKDCGGNIVLASADMGCAKWIEKLGNELDLSTAYIMKKRIDGIHTEVQALNADVKNRDVVIFDDMIRSGSSIIKAAIAYRDAGAKEIHVVAVHGVFAKNAIDDIFRTGVVKDIRCTNSHANTSAYSNTPNVQVYDITATIYEDLMLNHPPM